MTMNNCSSTNHQTVSGGKWWSVASVATTTLLRHFEVSLLSSGPKRILTGRPLPDIKPKNLYPSRFNLTYSHF
jgi:hypothetical protein